MIEKKTTKISRSWGATIGCLIGGAVMFGISVLFFLTIVEGTITFAIALIPVVIGLILISMSFGGSGKSQCPGCGAELSGLSTKSNDGVLCRNCSRYSEGKNGLLWLTDENRIADTPIFGSMLPEGFTFPPGCCVCGNTATKWEKISITTQNASSVLTAPTVGIRSDTQVSVDAPHCAAHQGGARLSGTAKTPLIRFRSYPCMRAFCRINGTQPG